VKLPRRGDIWWVDLPTPRDSEPGFRRPGVIIQADEFNRSNISTTVVALVTTNLGLADAPGNVFVSKRGTGLRQDSVVNVSQLLTIDREDMLSRIGTLPPKAMGAVDAGVRLLLGLEYSRR